MQIKKIVVLGPESTGKSTLCKQLAVHYNTIWVPEYAREYLETNGKEYTYLDLSLISEGQLNQEDTMINSLLVKNKDSMLTFIDTDLYVLKTWSEFVFNKCETKILRQIAERTYHLYLLCNTDLSWEKDELREYPDFASRVKLFHHYKDIMINQTVPWVEISGGYENRTRLAIEAVNRFCIQ
jgi:NadR type nicotinamide-nucleotide adenylyltransferase